MLRDRRILVTGATSGIGRALVRQYVANGAVVFAVGRREEALSEVTAIGGEGTAIPIQADLTTEAGRRGVATAVDHATGALDVVIHAAAALGPVGSGADLVHYPPSEWHRVFDVNVSAVHFLHQRLAAALDRGYRPAVIGVSSSVGRVGRGGWGMYSISKRALEGWLEVLAEEWGGRIYSVNPGATRTPMRAAAMPAEDPASLPSPDDVAPLFLRLAHPDAPEATGSKLSARDWMGRDPWEGISGQV